MSIENANRLDAGDIDFGFISAPWVAAAKPRHGALHARHRPAHRGSDESRPEFLHLLAPTPELRKVSDLRGKRVAVGMKDGGMAPHAEAVFAALGIGSGDLERVYVDFAEGAEMLATGAVDAQFQCPIPNRVMNELSERVLAARSVLRPCAPRCGAESHPARSTHHDEKRRVARARPRCAAAWRAEPAGHARA